MRFLAALVAIAATLLLGAGAAHADSPLTSTTFGGAYDDYPVVARARRSDGLDRDMAAYIGDPNNPVDVKLAIVSALSFPTAKRSVLRLVFYFREKYGWSAADSPTPYELPLADLAWDEAATLGYSAALADYFYPQRAEAILAHARKLEPDSFAVALIHTLIESQGEDCDGVRDYHRVLKQRDDGVLASDFRQSALDIVADYMKLLDRC